MCSYNKAARIIAKLYASLLAKDVYPSFLLKDLKLSFSYLSNGNGKIYALASHQVSITSLGEEDERENREDEELEYS
jgi:hypothetical protein